MSSVFIIFFTENKDIL